MAVRTLSVVLPLAVATVIAGWFLMLRPSFAGGPASYVMVSGDSMEPTLHADDLVVTRKQDSYAAGDIVAFHVPEGKPGEGSTVIHRIVGGSPTEGYVVQGDNKNAPDPWRPRPKNIVGRLWITVPGGARWVRLLRQPFPLAALAGTLGALSVLSAGRGKRARRSGASPPRSAAAAASGPTARSSDGSKPPQRIRLRPWLRLLTLLARPAKLIKRRRAVAKSAPPPKARPSSTPAGRAKALPTPSPASAKRTVSSHPAAKRMPKTLALAALAGAQVIAVALAATALLSAKGGRSRAMAKLLGQRSRRTGGVSTTERRAPVAAPILTKETLSPQPSPRPRLWWALTLAGMASAQAIGVGVAVVALWATGSIFYSGDGGTCLSEPAVPTTDMGPGPALAFDPSGLACVAPAPGGTVQADGLPQVAAVLPAQASPVPVQAIPILAEAAAVPPEPSPTPPEESPAPAPPPAIPTFDYVVQPGETLWQVAMRFGTTVERLVDLNGLTDSRLIFYGQKLKVPQ